MTEASDLRLTSIPLNSGSGRMPALGFGTLIPDAAETITATKGALQAGFRQFDSAERYRNGREVGQALQAGMANTGIAREDIFVTAKLWTPIIGPSVCNRLSRPACKGSGSITRMLISFILRLLFSREMNWMRGIKTAMFSTTTA